MRLVQTTLRLDYDTVSLHVRNSRITVRVHLSDVQTIEIRTEKTEFKTLGVCYDRNRIILPIVTPSETVLSFLETAATSAVRALVCATIYLYLVSLRTSLGNKVSNY